MPSIVSNKDAEKCLREILNSEGYELSSERKFGETGVDVIASRYNDIFHIEVIGYKSSGPARAKDFYESFFRVISRIKDGAERCVIAMPINAKIGLPARANQYGVAWGRIGLAFPELEIWLIDTENRCIEKSTWSEWGQSTTA
jgi:hypothetical protein